MHPLAVFPKNLQGTSFLEVVPFVASSALVDVDDVAPELRVGVAGVGAALAFFGSGFSGRNRGSCLGGCTVTIVAPAATDIASHSAIKCLK